MPENKFDELEDIIDDTVDTNNVFNPEYTEQTTVEPEPVYTEQTTVEPEPVYAEQQPVEPEPVYTEQQPVEPEPVYTEQQSVESESVYTEQTTVEPEPVYTEQQSVNVQSSNKDEDKFIEHPDGKIVLNRETESETPTFVDDGEPIRITDNKSLMFMFAIGAIILVAIFVIPMIFF